jgi:hypothetical protein
MIRVPVWVAVIVVPTALAAMLFLVAFLLSWLK